MLYIWAMSFRLTVVVTDGEAMVNQASLTGESVPVRKTWQSASVYAGTVVEEGELTLKVKCCRWFQPFREDREDDRGIRKAEIRSGE